MRVLVLDDNRGWARALQAFCPDHEFDAFSYPELSAALADEWGMALVDIQLAPWHDNTDSPTGLDALELIAQQAPRLACYLHSQTPRLNPDRLLFQHAAFWLHSDSRSRNTQRARLVGAIDKQTVDEDVLRRAIALVELGASHDGSERSFQRDNHIPALLSTKTRLGIWRALAGGADNLRIAGEQAFCTRSNAAGHALDIARYLTRHSLVLPGLPTYESRPAKAVPVVREFALIHRPFFRSRQAEQIAATLDRRGDYRPDA